jgi:hypothetical protein
MIRSKSLHSLASCPRPGLHAQNKIVKVRKGRCVQRIRWIAVTVEGAEYDGVNADRHMDRQVEAYGLYYQIHIYAQAGYAIAILGRRFHLHLDINTVPHPAFGLPILGLEVVTTPIFAILAVDVKLWAPGVKGFFCVFHERHQCRVGKRHPHGISLESFRTYILVRNR